MKELEAAVADSLGALIRAVLVWTISFLAFWILLVALVVFSLTRI